MADNVLTPMALEASTPTKRTRRGGRGRTRRRGTQKHELAAAAMASAYGDLYATAIPLTAATRSSGPGRWAATWAPAAAAVADDESDDESVCSRATASSSESVRSRASSTSASSSSSSSKWWSAGRAAPAVSPFGWRTAFEGGFAAAPAVPNAEDDAAFERCEAYLFSILDDAADAAAAVVSDDDDEPEAPTAAAPAGLSAAADRALVDRALADKAVRRARHEARRRKNERKASARSGRAAAPAAEDAVFAAAIAEHRALLC